MSERRALEGEFADIKTVKTRSVVQIIIELPIENGESVVKMLGFPQPGKPVRVALARLADAPQIEAQAEPAPATNGNGKKVWREYSPAQQAGILCNDPPFWKFLTEVGGANVSDEAGAASYVRLACHVHSRSELNVKPISRRLWFDIDSKYQAWLQVPVE